MSYSRYRSRATPIPIPGRTMATRKSQSARNCSQNRPSAAVTQNMNHFNCCRSSPRLRRNRITRIGMIENNVTAHPMASTPNSGRATQDGADTWRGFGGVRAVRRPEHHHDRCKSRGQHGHAGRPSQPTLDRPAGGKEVEQQDIGTHKGDEIPSTEPSTEVPPHRLRNPTWLLHHGLGKATEGRQQHNRHHEPGDRIARPSGNQQTRQTEVEQLDDSEQDNVEKPPETGRGCSGLVRATRWRNDQRQNLDRNADRRQCRSGGGSRPPFDHDRPTSRQSTVPLPTSWPC